MKANLFDRRECVRRFAAAVVALAATAAWTMGAWAMKPPSKPSTDESVKRVPVQTERGTAYKLVPVEQERSNPASATEKSATAQNPAAPAPPAAPAESKTPPAPLPPGARPVVKVLDGVKDFGTIWAGPTLDHSFTVKNEGNAPLEITKVKPSCGCTIAGKYPQKLEPGESGEFPFTLVSTKVRGKFEKGITISTNDPAKADVQLYLRGEVKQYVQVTPDLVDFGKLHGTEAKTQVVKLTSNTDTPLKLEIATPPGENFDATLTESTPGKAYELQITAKPPFDKPDRIRKSVALKTNIQAVKSIEIPVRASIPSRIDVQPSQLTVGSVKGLPQMTEKGLTRVVSFDNYGPKPTKLLEAKADDPEIAVKVEPKVEGKSYNIQVQFPPGYKVPDAGRTITLKTDDAEKPTIAIPVKGAAQPSTAAATPPATPPATTPKRPAEEMVGQAVPTFSATTTAGKSLSSADLVNGITVLDFFAVNCGFCGKQIPTVETVRKQFADAGVRFVAVGQTMGEKKFTEQETIDKIKELGFHGELVVDPDNALGRLFKVNSYPTMAVIGKTGKVEAVNMGALADLDTKLQGQLGALVAGKPVPTEAVAQKPEANKPTPERKTASDLLGKPAPAFSIETMDGKPVSNAELAAHPATVLNIFAPNCGYCKKQIPRLEKIRADYVAKGVRFVLVSQTMGKKFTADEVAAIAKEVGPGFELAYEPDNKIGGLFNASGFPTMIVLGKSGKIEATNIGNLTDLEDRVKGQLDALIAGKPVPQTEATAEKPATPEAQPKRPAEAIVGQDAPAFTLTTVAGAKVSNETLKGTVTVLDFFSKTCGHCMKQIPRVEEIRKTYADKGVRFIAVGKGGTEDELKAKVGELGFQGDLVVDTENVAAAFKVQGVPSMAIVGKTGKVEAVNVGNIPDLETKMKEQLDAMLAGKPVPQSPSAAATPPSAQPPAKRPAEEMAGKMAPAFNLTTIEGKTFSNTDLAKHSATVLNVFAPNCGYCKKQIPNVEKVRQEYEAKGVRFVNVAQKMGTDFTPEQIQDIIKGLGVNLELATSDFSVNQVGQAFKATSFPTMFVIGKDGKIANVNVGAKADIDTLLKGQLDALIAGK